MPANQEIESTEIFRLHSYGFSRPGRPPPPHPSCIASATGFYGIRAAEDVGGLPKDSTVRSPALQPLFRHDSRNNRFETNSNNRRPESLLLEISSGTRMFSIIFIRKIRRISMGFVIIWKNCILILVKS